MTQPGQPGGALAQRPAAPAPTGGLFGRPGFMGGLFAGLPRRRPARHAVRPWPLRRARRLRLDARPHAADRHRRADRLSAVDVVAAPQPAGAGERPVYCDMPSGDSPRASLVALGGVELGAGAPAARASGTDEVGTTPEDFNTFERLLGEIQAAYSAEDLGQLRAVPRPETVSYFAEDLAANATRGVVNRISDVKLLQGDLAEAWREGDTDYATVAMRFALNDQTIDRASGRVIEGGPEEATEVWTFMRVRGGHWLVSAIQQA